MSPSLGDWKSGDGPCILHCYSPARCGLENGASATPFPSLTVDWNGPTRRCSALTSWFTLGQKAIKVRPVGGDDSPTT